jgi:paraquat-inducible protein B
MSDTNQGPELPNLPSAIAHGSRRWVPQIIWIIPIIAVVVGLSLMYKAVVDHGPTITVAFKTGDGITAGKTFVKFKDVNIGLVKTVELSEDHQQVIAKIQLDQGAADSAKEDTRFWIVRPRISANGVSGLSTLLDGPFIAADLGKSEATREHFVALEVPPILTGDSPGREFILRAPTLGSHNVGTPVYFRRISVGQVIANDLDKDGKSVSIKIFINAPYDQYVINNTRFWNASGIDVTVNASGVQLQTESLIAVIAGGIAFEAPQRHTDPQNLIAGDDKQSDSSGLPKEGNLLSDRAKADTVFTLFDTRLIAMKQPDLRSQRFVINFKSSVRGLSVGAPVEFRGVNFGEVVNIETAMDPKTLEIIQPVEIFLYPDRLQVRSIKTGKILPPPTNEIERLQALIKKGMRAQLLTGSFLTGQKYIGIDIFPNAPKYTLDLSRNPLELPAIPNELDDVEKSLTSVIKNTDKLVKKLDNQIIPQFDKTLKNVNTMTDGDSPLLIDMRDSLREITKAANSVKTLTDMLDQQPQSIIYGKPTQESK